MSDLDLAPIVERDKLAIRALKDWRDGDDREATVSAFAQSADNVPALVDEVRKLRAIVERVRTLNDDPTFGWPGYIRRDQISEALVDQCHHYDGEAECWHFGDRDGRDG